MSNLGYFNVDNCIHCDVVNSRSHVTDKCSHFNAHRDTHRRKFMGICPGLEQDLPMESILLKLYFCPDKSLRSKDHQAIVEVIKSFITGLWFNNQNQEKKK